MTQVRDIVQGIALVLMAWMYLTPIIYPESIVPAQYRLAINLNPFTPHFIHSHPNILKNVLCFSITFHDAAAIDVERTFKRIPGQRS